MSVTTQRIDLSRQVPESMEGKRLDQIASELIPDYSRSRLQRWIKEGCLTVDGQTRKAKEKLSGGETITLIAEPEAVSGWQAQDIQLQIVYEDESLLVLNKQAGLVVHPAAGNRDGTLLNGLVNYLPQLEAVPRAGIVHRLDKDTTGLMVVAKTLESHTHLVRQLQERTVGREYEAVVLGVMTGGGTVTGNIGRHPQVRVKMAVLEHGGKEAVTHYRLLNRFMGYSHIRVKLETGRTHQIRVHMAHINYPLVGDTVYGGRLKLPKGATPELVEALRNFKRQALHAASLSLIHPATEETFAWQAPLPADLQVLIATLQNASHS